MKLVLFLVAATATAGLVGLGFVSARMAVESPREPTAVATAAAIPSTSDIATRLAAIESRLQALETTGPTNEPSDERYLVALLHLQDVARSARPWQRELQFVLQLAGPDRLNATLVAVLRSHAAQGVPTRPELRRGFIAAGRAILSETSFETGVIQGLLHGGQSAAAGLGLAPPPPPGRTQSTLNAIGQRLDRGDLAGALHDAALLDSQFQPRIAEWTAEVRARLAVEQAIQELLAQSLSDRSGRP